jgi:hypothetical protein
MLKKQSLSLFISSLALVFVWPQVSAFGTTGQIEEGEMAGYLLVPHEKVEETYNAGFSIYAAAWAGGAIRGLPRKRPSSSWAAWP